MTFIFTFSRRLDGTIQIEAEINTRAVSQNFSHIFQSLKPGEQLQVRVNAQSYTMELLT